MNESKNPTIDAIIPVYNGQDFILKALKSVANQTCPPHEIIVINDGSTDATESIVTAFASASSIPVRLITKENGGLSSARNAGIAVSKSSYIAFLDADDIWAPTKLELQFNVFAKNVQKNIGLVYCKYDVIKKDGSYDPHATIVPLDTKVRRDAFTSLLVANKVLSSGSGVLIKREVFQSVGNFDETLRFGEDWDMWLRIAQEYALDYTNHILVHIRRHDNNMTSTEAVVFKGELAFYNKWVPLIQNKYPIPLFWKDKIAGRIIRRFPKTDFLHFPKKLLKSDVYTALFKNKISLPLHIVFFFFRKILSIIKSQTKRILKLHKQHHE